MPYVFNPFTGNLDYTASSGGAGGTGDVVGPSSATDNAVARFDATTGKLIQDSSVIVGDAGGISTTIADTGNAIGVNITQNDVTNNPKALSITNAGTGASLFIDPNGNTGTGNSTGGALVIENSGNTSWAINARSTANAPTRFVQFVVNSAFTTTVNGIQTIDNTSTQLTVTSTSGFPSSGTIRVLNNTSTTENGKMIYLHYTSVDATHFIGTAGVFYKASTSIATVDGGLIDYINTSNTYLHTLIEDTNSNGGSTNLKLRGPNPDLEFHALGGYYNDAGEGQFEIDIPAGDNVTRTDSDVIRINGRNDANTSFNPNTIFTRPGLSAQGMVGIGFQNKTSPTTLAAHLHVKNDTNYGDTNAPALIGQIIQGASGQTANLLEFRADGSTTPLTKVTSAGNIIVGTAGTAAGSVGTIDGVQTLTNKTLTSPVINTGVSGTAIDTDGTLAANSDTVLASQKATKTYATAKSTLTTKGDMYVATGASTVVRQAIGSDTNVLIADSSQTNGLKWGATPSDPLLYTILRRTFR